MNNPHYAAFPGGLVTEGLTKKEYVFIEVLKSLIKPGTNYEYSHPDELITSANLITEKVFEQ